MGWKDDPIVSDAAIAAPEVEVTPWQNDPVVEPPSTMEKVGRQGGLLTRSLVEGVASIPGIGADAVNTIINLGIEAYNKGTNSQIPKLPMATTALSNTLTNAGLPIPETGLERVVSGVNSALSGTGSTIAAGARMAPGAVKSLLTTRPDIQLQAAGGAAAASGVTREEGGGPIAQTAMGIAGGAVAPAAVSLARGVPAFFQPFTEKGQRNIAGQVLHDAASSPADARTALSNADEIVPGSRPTMAAATRDPGLASLERSLTAKPTGSTISERYAQNNAARMDEMNNLSGNKASIARAEAARDAATSASREAAFQSARVGSPSSAVIQNIDATLKSPVGKREVVQQALTWAKSRLQGVTDPRELYAVRQDIGDAMGGKLAGDKASFKLATAELVKLRDQLDDVIEADAPGFKAYLQKFKDESKPINQMEILQEITRRSIGTAEDSMGNRQLLPSGFQRSMDDIDDVAASATGFKKAKAEDILTDVQKKRLENLRKDLTGEAYAKGGGKVSGSNTVQLANYSTANVLGRIASGKSDTGPITRNLVRGLDWLNKYNDRDIDRLLVEAAKDPALAGTLMQSATKYRLELASDELKKIARGIGLGTATSQPAQREQQDRGMRQ